MTQENKSNAPASQEISSPESDLEELKTRIWEANRYLMGTFFQDDTWDVRQAGSYLLPILEIQGDGKDHDWEKEKQVAKSIIGDLGNRVQYYEAAYHFPDVLAALAVGCGQDWVDMFSKQSGEPKAVVAQRILERTRVRLTEETQKFKEFLESDILGQAFTIQVNRKTAHYAIYDLSLNRYKLKTRWHELLTDDPDKEQIVNLDEQFAALKKELVQQIMITYHEGVMHYRGIYIRVVSNERDGGDQALLLDSNGIWSGKCGMGGFEMGEDPSTDSLIEEYAEIQDDEYRKRLYSSDRAEKATSKQYFSENRERLFVELMNAMEARLQELRDSKVSETL